MAQASRPSQSYVPVKDIRDGVVILKNGQLSMVLFASSINFALKSSEEQQAILSQFQAFLNTLDFSLQIYIQSRRFDVRPYLELIASRESTQDNDLMRLQLREYIEFIREFTTKVDIMSKSFFVVIPYTPSIFSGGGITDLLKPGEKKTELSDEQFLEERSQLEQRVAIVEQGLGRIGVRTVPLGTEELTELFYHIFNPEDLSHAPQVQ